MPKGIFPNMNIPDIITALGGWGLSVSPDQLAHPTADFVEGVYCACLQQVTGLTYDSLRDPVAASVGTDNEACLSNLLSSPKLIHPILTGPLRLCLFQQPSSIPLVRPLPPPSIPNLIDHFLGAASQGPLR
jgi:hypothetical protein